MHNRVTEIVTELPDVRKVFNELAIGARPRSSSDLKDMSITSQVKSRLMCEDSVPISKIKVVTEVKRRLPDGSGDSIRKPRSRPTVARTTSGVTKVVTLFEYHRLMLLPSRAVRARRTRRTGGSAAHDLPRPARFHRTTRKNGRAETHRRRSRPQTGNDRDRRPRAARRRPGAAVREAQGHAPFRYWRTCSARSSGWRWAWAKTTRAGCAKSASCWPT